MNSNNNNLLSRRQGQKQKPPRANRRHSQKRRFQQHPESSEQETGAFAIPGADGASESILNDVQDDITLLEPQGNSQPQREEPPPPGDSNNNNAEPVVAKASLVDEEAEAERSRLLEERTARLQQVEREREEERRRMLALETELQLVRATGGGNLPTAYVQSVPPRDLVHGEEEKQEVENPAPPDSAVRRAEGIQDQQDGPRAPPRDLEAQPEEVLPTSVRLVDDDSTRTGTSAELHDEENEESHNTSHKRGRHDRTADSAANTRQRRRRRRCALLAAGTLVLVAVAAVVITVMAAGKSSGGGRSSNNNTGSASTQPPTVPPDRVPAPVPVPVATNPPTATPSLSETISWKKLGANLNGAAAGDEFGYSIALSADGKILAVGAPLNNANGRNSGHVRVFAYGTETSGRRWKQLGADLRGEAAHNQFGRSVALSADGTILAVGATGNDANGEYSGHVRVFVYSKAIDQWNKLGANVNGEAAWDASGTSVALSSDGTVLAVGARGNDGNGNGSGHVRVFRFDSDRDRWNQLGADLRGAATLDWFGSSVALSSSGLIVAVGGPQNDANGDSSGHVRVFAFNTTSNKWNQLGGDLDGKGAGDKFGMSVTLSSSGFILAVGGPEIDRNPDRIGSGYVRVFEYTMASNEWKQLGGDLDGKAVGDSFGFSVALSSDGTVLAVGGPYNDDAGLDSGHARIYQYNKANETWNKVGGDVNGEAAGDWFGRPVALSADGTIVAVGAFQNDDNGVDSGQVQVFQSKNSDMP